MSEVKVNKISPRTNCGTVQLGDSGDTITIPAGATITNNGTQTGFGRTGAVDWQTSSIKTATFTATSGEGYFCNTSGGAFTVNLPAGSAGAIVAVSDYTRTFNSNNLTVSPNGSEKIGGVAGDIVLSVNGQALTLVYVDGTEGWINVQNAEDTEFAADFISATGGTITNTPTCRIHTFTGPGTFEITQLGAPANNKIAYVVVAGGGGSGGNRWHIQGGGGGGAGGFREGRDNPITPYTASPLAAACSALTATAGSFPITVGGGGAAGGTGGGPGGPLPEGANATSGSNSIFSTITSAGGGFGGNPRCQGPAQPEGQPGGSGGGGGGGSPSRAGGTGNTPPTNPAQGQDGGNGSTCNQTLGGSGGGAIGAGSTSPGPSPPPSASSGGTGATTSISASPVVYATGGTYSSYNPGTLDPSCAGADNTGDGGDARNAGPGGNNPATPSNYSGLGGGSGVVIIRYKKA